MPSAPRPLAIAAVLVATASLGPALAQGSPSATAPPQVAVAVDGPARVPTGPVALIARPRAGATISGTVRPGLRIRALRSVRRLEMRIDGRLVDRWRPKTSRAPEWRTTTVADGDHVIEVRTFGPHGMRRVAQTVTVSNVTGRRGGRKPTSPSTPAPTSPAPGGSTPSSPAPPPSGNGLDIPGVIMKVGDYNTGDLSQWSGHQNLSSYSLTTVRSPVREGGYAARFEVRQGDDPLCAAGYGCFGDRSEVQMSTGETEGQERWYSWSTMFSSDFPRYPNWQVVSQWHSNANGSPPIGFYVVNDSLVLQFHRYSSPDHPIDIVTPWSGPLRRGQWQDIRLHVKWSGSDSVGFVELWINGVAQTFDNGQTRRYIRNMYPGIPNYFKQGYYRQSGLPATGVIYHDGFRMSRPS
jgi:hypothetical protein